MPTLDPSARRLLTWLVSRLNDIVPDDQRTFPGYKAAHDALRLPRQGPTWGISLKQQGLEALARWAQATGAPPITVIVIDTAEGRPGSGLPKLIGEDRVADPQRRRDDVIACQAFDWSPWVEVAPTTATPAIWRLIAHHDRPREAFAQMRDCGVIAIGWSDAGDLDALRPTGANDITRALQAADPTRRNAHLGGPSLWNLYRKMRPGDLVIVAGAGRLGVLEVLGDYAYADDGNLLGYAHQRAAALTNLDPETLWRAVGSDFAAGESGRWTLALCRESDDARTMTYREGRRWQVLSTAIERNPAAREACLRHHGRACFVCGFDFGAVYGALGAGYIHVHHRHDLALSAGDRRTDPIRDLVPLCPNCHAMVHTRQPALSPEALKSLVSERRAALR